MKLYVIAGVLSLIILYMWWDGHTKYKAGYNAAEAKYVKAINKANDDHATAKGALITKHIKGIKDATNKTAKVLKQLRAANDGCLSKRMPDATTERMRREREAVGQQ